MARIKPDKFYLYCISEEESRSAGPCKVGVASYLDSRLCSLQGGNPRRLKIEWVPEFKDRTNALDVERHILGRVGSQRNGSRRLCSEWLDADPDEIWRAGSELIAALIDEESR